MSCIFNMWFVFPKLFFLAPLQILCIRHCSAVSAFHMLNAASATIHWFL
jgi:hypothetical protein